MSPSPDATRPKGPQRTCVGCREESHRGDLVRFAFDGERLVPDARGTLPGRGVWVHARAACVRRAVRGGGVHRALRTAIALDERAMIDALRVAVSARVDSYLLAGARARRVVFGTDETCEAVRAGSCRCVLVAEDARASREAVEEAATARGVRVVVHGDKAALGRLFRKMEVGALGVVDDALAGALLEATATLVALAEGE